MTSGVRETRGAVQGNFTEPELPVSALPPDASAERPARLTADEAKETVRPIPEMWAKLRYNVFPGHIVGEVLTKGWSDNLVPLIALIATILFLGAVLPSFYTATNFVNASRQLGEFILVVIGLTVVMLGGGIDLSVGATFALSTFAAVWVIYVDSGPVWLALLAALGVGGVLGSINGALIGYLRLRAFLTTIVTLIIFRAVYEIMLIHFSTRIQVSSVENGVWDFIGDGGLGPLPVSFVVALVVAFAAHIFITRSRPGWRVVAVGGSRRSAYNTGISIAQTVFLTYVISGLLCGMAGFLIGARLSGVGPGTGSGLEIMALTAAVVGGNSLGGGRGSIGKAVMGSVVVLLLTNGLIRLGFGSGSNQFLLGVLLAAAVLLDVRWLKNRHKVLTSMYIAPIYSRTTTLAGASAASHAADLSDDRLSAAMPIGLGEIEGPEDVILDEADHLYTGTRHGEVIRFLAPDYGTKEVFAHTGGFPLGMAFDRDGALKVCVGAMGLYSITPDRQVTRLSASTNRSLLSVIDDSRLRDPNDCDIAPDGRIYFTDSTTRYEAHDWALDAIESRPTGRVLCFDPPTGRTRTILRGLRYTNGVCLAHDGRSFFFAESWACRVHRYWLEGPKAGRAELVISNMPGYPDNINRASDGNYWMAWLGMRTPSFDLALRMPGVRRRMTRRLPQDDWLFPNINTGGIAKFTESGRIIERFGDPDGTKHPMVTSMREHKGYLYVGGILNNRIGRLKLDDVDPNWTGFSSYWGQCR